MRDKSAPDVRVAALAARQHGVVSSRQLRQAGLSRNAILERSRRGRLHRLHRGVYAVGHVAPSNERRWMAAVLAVAESARSERASAGRGWLDAALSHRSAAALWELLPPIDGPVDVSVPGRGGRRQRSGLRVHRPASLPARDITRRHGIPTTSPARTLADLRTLVTGRELRRATRQADVLGLAAGPDAALDRTRSELEHLFLQLCGRHGLPRPAVNVRVGSLTVDFLWKEERLVVETDGYRFHRGRAAFEEDRSRDLEPRSAGYTVMRFSYRQVTDEAARVAASLRKHLAA